MSARLPRGRRRSRSPPSAFWPTLAATLLVIAVAVARGDAACSAPGSSSTPLLLVASFALTTPMGGNAVRLGALLAGPAAGAARCRAGRRRWLVLLVARRSLYWQWTHAGRRLAPRRRATRRSTRPTTAGCSAALRAPSRGPVPPRDPVHRQPLGGARVAPHVPLARGWERQLDRKVNRALLRRPAADAGALPRAGCDDNARRATSRWPTRRWTTRPPREAALVRAGTPVPARGLARRALARCSRSPATPAWPTGGARHRLGRRRLHASPAAPRAADPRARALDALLGARARARLRRARARRLDHAGHAAAPGRGPRAGALRARRGRGRTARAAGEPARAVGVLGAVSPPWGRGASL